MFNRSNETPANGYEMDSMTVMAHWHVAALLRDDAAPQRAWVANMRLVQFVAELPPTERVSLILSGDPSGHVDVDLYATPGVADLEDGLVWACGQVARWTRIEPGIELESSPPSALLELRPRALSRPALHRLGLADESESGAQPTRPATPLGWAFPYLNDGTDILGALRSTGGQVRIHLAGASPLEHELVGEMVTAADEAPDGRWLSEYIGLPLRARCLVGQSGPHVSPRLRATMRRLGVGIELVDLDPADVQVRRAWRGDPESLEGAALPMGVALTLMRMPAAPERPAILGVPTEVATEEPVPVADLSASPVGQLRLGTAWSTTGQQVEVRVQSHDLLRHVHVSGATGTGKSTFLAALVSEAAAQGLGVTVLDAHGTLVSRLVNELTDEARDRALVVRSGDVENPVPINAVGPSAPEMLRETIVGVMRELLDPGNQGFMGPRHERIQAQALAAGDILLGDRSSLSAIPFLLADQEQIRNLAKAIRSSNPDLAGELENELGRMPAAEFGDLIGWFKSKFQRMVQGAAMRAILGTGQDALDITQVVDDCSLLFVDLSAPAIGVTSAQLLGELWLAKHWAALERRADPDRPHLLIVDECHLFASGLLPRLLAEGRKFGLAVVLAHQHLQQLTPALREAALANSSTVVSFRCGPHEARAALDRLGAWTGRGLTRLPNLDAAVSLSTSTAQSDAFTLRVDHNQRVAVDLEEAAVRARIVAEQSCRTLVDPYRGCPGITSAEITNHIERRIFRGAQRIAGGQTSLFDDWLAKQADSETSA